jgi:BirA family biotin operon repressor/biotin-[acetyl-CoA-carboxylase] ligase
MNSTLSPAAGRRGSVTGVDRYSDLERPPLRADALKAALAPDGYDLVVLEQTESTNADLAERARAGAAEGTVVVAESQTAGRGRQGRSWESPPRAGLTFSVLLRPPQVSGWLPLLTGLAVAVAMQEQAGVAAGLKWPNDVLVGASDSARKVAGVLAEVPGGTGGTGGAGGAVVIGIGLNVTTRAAELPDDRATSLALAGALTTDRETLLKAILRSLARAYASWRADPEALIPAYRSACVTLGRQVRVELPDGQSYEGLAADIDNDGRLLVADRAFAAGDVIHLR